MSLIINPYRFAAGVAPGGYPYAMPVLHPGIVGDAATFDAASWTGYSGSNLGNSGPSYYLGSATAARAWHGQVVDIPAVYWPDIDAGKCKLTRITGISSFTGDSDTMMCGIDCLASDFTYLGGNWHGYSQGSNDDEATFLDVSVECLVPPNTRKVRVHQRALRFTGTENSVYFSNIRVTLDLSGYIFEPFYACRGAVPADWTLRNGATAGRVTTWGAAWHNVADETGLPESFGGNAGGVAANWGIKQELLVSNMSVDAQAAAAVGALSVFMQAIIWDNTNIENGYIYLRPHGTLSGDADIVGDQNVGTINLRDYGSHFRLVYLLDSATVARIEFLLYGVRDGGSYADSIFNYTHMGIFYPAP